MLSELINTGPTVLALSAIVNDGGTQMRAGMNAAKVTEYEEVLADADAWPFPPLIVFYDGAKYWLADGFHRLNAAHRSRKYAEIPAEIKAGTRRDAVLHAAGANSAHGLPRTDDDKRRAVETLVLDEEWGKWSNREIARRCNVGEKLVRHVKKTLGIDTAAETQYTHPKTGETTTMQTANIGANRSAPPAMLAVWELEATVRDIYAQVYGGNPAPYATRDMRIGAQIRAGRFWLLCTQSLPANQFRLSDLAQAINNVASRFEDPKRTEAVVTTTIAPTVAYVVPAEPDTWKEALQQRKFDTLDLRCNRLAAAMLPWAQEWTDDKGRTWRDVASKNPQHANSPFRQDVEAEYRRRGIPVFEEATAQTIRKLFNLLSETESLTDMVVNGDRALPDWTEPEAGAAPESAQSAALPVDIADVMRLATAIERVLHGREQDEIDAILSDLHDGPYYYRDNVLCYTDDCDDIHAWRYAVARVRNGIMHGIVRPHAAEPAVVEPEPQPEPVESIPVSLRADYESDEWYTPQEYIDAAKAVMGAIDLDPATSEMAQTVVRAGVYLTRFDDGLSQTRWIHQRIWLNPPYSNPAPWVEKLVREHQAGPFCTEAIVLVNNATETSWFQLLLERFPVCLPARRLAFWRHDHANVGARQGQAFFYLGPNGARFQKVFSQFGPILRRLS